MPVRSDVLPDPWPPLAYPDFASTQYLFHMGLQAVGKLKLKAPFQPQWSAVPLWISARGLTTGPIDYAGGAYEVSADLISHELTCVTSWGAAKRFKLASMSVAEFVEQLFDLLQNVGIDVSINLMPQEVASPTRFDQDQQQRAYEPAMANRWWRILLSTQRVMQMFRGGFQGKTQPIGLMWGTLDIRDVLFNGKPAAPAPNADYIRRNAMNAELIEMGWWAGSAAYPRPAFYSFTYPQPAGIEDAEVSPASAHWDAAMGEFILDYDELRKSKDPDADLLQFFRSAFHAGAECARWDPHLMGSGRPD
ncbi:hypothetical protein ISN76_18720 [Dyella halodurans]|uniref:DUF5996 family protein n=1 Tax=Dyella halodurans TaxID=1920171 RepID=A0ABV9C8T5_9GAMM|nr:DUF5996 family protein [Dyella halodurans]